MNRNWIFVLGNWDFTSGDWGFRYFESISALREPQRPQCNTSGAAIRYI